MDIVGQELEDPIAEYSRISSLIHSTSGPPRFIPSILAHGNVLTRDSLQNTTVPMENDQTEVLEDPGQFVRVFNYGVYGPNRLYMDISWRAIEIYRASEDLCVCVFVSEDVPVDENMVVRMKLEKNDGRWVSIFKLGSHIARLGVDTNQKKIFVQVRGACDSFNYTDMIDIATSVPYSDVLDGLFGVHTKLRYREISKRFYDPTVSVVV